MDTVELSSKTVIELRKLAKEHGVTLGAGVNKEAIIAKIAQALGSSCAPAGQEAPAPAPAPAAAPAQPQSVAEPAPQPKAEAPAAAPQYKAAWHNPGPRYNSKPAYQAPAYQQRPNASSGSWQTSRIPAADQPRPAAPRPSFTPRFGPGARSEEPAYQQNARHEDDYRPYRQEQPARTGYGPAAQERRSYDAPRAYDNPQRPAYSDPGYDAPAYQPRQSGYDQRPRYDQRPAYQAPRRDGVYAPQQENQPNPAVNELLTAGECLDGSGVLELHPDGYGFLRSDNFLPSGKDIYVAMAQIRRFGLRTGDYVVGKTRPQRDGDKYAALLYITEVNGVPADELASRPSYEELTPVYPSRRIDLEAHDGKHVDSMRLADLIAPIGFGQRGLLLCPPDTGKTELLRDFANAVTANYPDVTVMMLLIDENPEDVTCFREQVNCQVLASTFDQPPENHLRLTEIVLERAQRLVEQGRDVIVFVDSLTRLAKIYTTSAAQQGRGAPGMVNPSSLFRAKKLFGAARCMKEGGSLTVIGAMNVQSGNKVDDTIVEEFKGTANMEIWLDADLARAGVSPAINLQLSGTKRAELLLTPAQLEGLNLIRSIMTSARSVTAVPQLLSMMDKADGNDDLMLKIKDWVALMNAKA
ncbi:MAG: transcription termination factor Rho [Clostridia bacterium]|nr:transcription termination factor Rho [Clostridia bacterium]